MQRKYIKASSHTSSNTHQVNLQHIKVIRNMH